MYVDVELIIIYIHQGETFPEITKKVDEIKEILDEEEESFSRTLDRGEKLFDQFASRAKEQNITELNGKDVWRLYDTYGFPVDLTRLMAEELGLTVNDKEFEEAQAASKEASKASLKKGSSAGVKLDVHDIATLEKNDAVPKTDDSAKFSEQLSSLACSDYLNVYLKTLATSTQISRPSSTTKHSSQQRLKSPRIRRSVYS